MNFIDKQMQLQQCLRIKQHRLGPRYKSKENKGYEFIFKSQYSKKEKEKKNYMNKANLI